jgi:predicted Rossmann fold nucleotide-binding protein DprA/Smf involved in DNA uptake
MPAASSLAMFAPTASHSEGSAAPKATASDMAAALLALLGQRGGWSVDALVDASGLHAGEVQGVLLGLELDGLVEHDGFGGYAECVGWA